MYELSIVLTEVGPVVEGESKKETVVKHSTIAAYNDSKEAVAFFNATVESSIETNSQENVCDRYYD
ncbi:hypothetical protein LCGC14_2703450 [marine sediment metagenome]|uniref:Uncharacterized protein n=1 Tax=marine sediment metagenome TaxID=412755 RepID=A0A0F9BP99_9ZZZZ